MEEIKMPEETNMPDETTMSLGKRLVKVVTSPSKAFAEIARDPRILWPALILIVINLILTVAIIPETKVATEQMMIDSGAGAQEIAIALSVIVPGTVIGVIVLQPIMWLIFAAVLLLYNQFSVGAARFKQLFAVAIYSTVPSLILGAISTVLIKTVGFESAMQVNTSLAIFLGDTDSPGFLYRLLGKIELFSLWALVLLILGGATAMKKKPRNLAVYMTAIWLVFAVVMALIGGMMPTV